MKKVRQKISLDCHFKSWVVYSLIRFCATDLCVIFTFSKHFDCGLRMCPECLSSYAEVDQKLGPQPYSKKVRKTPSTTFSLHSHIHFSLPILLVNIFSFADDFMFFLFISSLYSTALYLFSYFLLPDLSFPLFRSPSYFFLLSVAFLPHVYFCWLLQAGLSRTYSFISYHTGTKMKVNHPLTSL